ADAFSSDITGAYEFNDRGFRRNRPTLTAGASVTASIAGVNIQTERCHTRIMSAARAVRKAGAITENVIETVHRITKLRVHGYAHRVNASDPRDIDRLDLCSLRRSSCRTEKPSARGFAVNVNDAASASKPL